MKHYTLAHSTPDHYVLHDKRDGQMFHIAKKGIDKDLHELIKNMPPMKADEPGDEDMPDNRDIPGTDSRPTSKQPQKYVSGGEVESPGPEEPRMPDSPVSYNPTGDDASLPYFSTTKENSEAPTPGTLIEQRIGHSEGGPVIDPNKAKDAQDSMRKAFKFDEGGAVPEQGPAVITASKLESQYAPEEQAAQASVPPVPQEPAPVQNVAPAAERAPASEPAQPETPYYLAKPEGAPAPVQTAPASQPVEAEAKKDLAKAAVDHQEKQSNLDQQLQENQNRYQALIDKQQADDQRFSQLVATSKIDPNRFVNNQNLMQKITMGLGIALGGVGAGVTHTSNDALEVVNQAINRDIDAQKNDQSNKMNLWKMNHESTKDQQAATLQTRNQLLEAAKVKMDELMGTAPGPMAQQRAMALRTQIQAEQAENRAKIVSLKLKQDILSDVSKPSQPGKLSQKDPSSLVPYIVPADRQKEVFQEIKDAQNIAKTGPKILSAFDQAIKDKSLTSGKFNPASVNALHQLMLPLFEGIDGTVRQAAMDETFANVTPHLLDSGTKNETRRKALVDWMTSRSAAPTARGFGLDLSKYQSTSHDVGGQIKTMNGAKYQQVPGGWKKLD